MQEKTSEVVATLMKCKLIDADSYEYQTDSILDLASYYEMPLYCISNSDCARNAYEAIYKNWTVKSSLTKRT